MAAGISTPNRATVEKSYFLLKLKACAGQRVTLFERLGWKTPRLMHTLVFVFLGFEAIAAFRSVALSLL